MSKFVEPEMHLKQDVLSYPMITFSCAVIVHGELMFERIKFVPVKELPHKSPREHERVHPNCKVFCVKNVSISYVFPNPELTKG